MRSEGRRQAGHRLSDGLDAGAQPFKWTDQPSIGLALICSALVISPVVPSYISAVLYIILAAALIEVARHPRRHVPQLPEMLIAAVFAVYFVIGAVRGLTAPNPADVLSYLAPNIVFLLAAPLLPVLRKAMRPQNWNLVLSMLAAGGVAAGLYAEYYVFAISVGSWPASG